MKNYLVGRGEPRSRDYRGRILSCLIVGSCCVGCTSTDKLFEELPMEATVDDSTVEALPNQPSPPVESVGNGDQEEPAESTGGDLPLAGNFPPPAAPGNSSPSPDVEPCDEQPCGEEPTPASQAPVIVEVSPVDGGTGITNDVDIIIRFSQPMDREATEAAYQSESIPSGSVTFLWNEGDTELTIVPDAVLEYGAGSEPDLAEARRVSYFISASAADAEGRRLSQPYEFSFSLLRQVSFTLFALQDRDLSGSFRSNDTYGTGQCARGEINMCVGDARVAGENEQYRGFVSFEPSGLPDGIQALSATLSLEITATSGNPFAGLGGLVLEHTSFESIGSEAFFADSLDELGLIAEQGVSGTIVSAEVGEALIADGRERSLTQYRFRFEETTDDDNAADVILSAWDTQRLDVTYLLP
jgi:hypothetical protein